MFTEKFIYEQYNKIKTSWEKNLKQYGVKLSTLKKADGSYTINSLVLIYLFAHINESVSKEELTAFIRNMGYDVIDVQQARHLSAQSGWYIISGQRGDIECKQYGVSAGNYMLVSIEKPYPQFEYLRRSEQIKPSSWSDIKKHYNNRCLSCGSQEGAVNLLYPNSITKLQQGHKNPGNPLTLDNIIPQCQFCNGSSQNFFVFDNKGKILKIYNPTFILKSENDVKQVMLQLLIEEDIEEAKNIIEKIEKS